MFRLGWHCTNYCTWRRTCIYARISRHILILRHRRALVSLLKRFVWHCGRTVSQRSSNSPYFNSVWQKWKYGT